MSENYFVEPSEGELILAHYGTMGQKWGIRKYQNPDGTLTEAGKRRYGTVQNFNKIQNARVDAEAYKIRAKAEAKVAKKQQKIEDKRNSKLEKAKQKEEDKRNLKMAKEMQKIQNKQAKKQAKIDEKYAMKAYKEQMKNVPKNSALKRTAGEFANNVVKPVAMNAARDMLSNVVNKKISELTTDESTKIYNARIANLNKQLENISLSNAVLQANIDYSRLKAINEGYRGDSAQFKNDWSNYRGGTLYNGKYDYYKRK